MTMNMITTTPASLEVALYKAADVIKCAQNIAILTGAGVSAESGISTFRDKLTGLWQQYQAEYLVSIQAFEKEPALVWQWHQWWRGQIADKQPNPAHFALGEWQALAKQQGKTWTLFSQNVDNLHEQGGATVAKLHGDLAKNRCHDCGKPYDKAIAITDTELKHCECGGLIRPDIVWFGEMLPQEAWQTAETAALNCDVLVSIGTSSVVYPAAGLIDLAKQQGATVIEINPHPTQTPEVDIVLQGKAGKILPLLVKALK